MKYESSAGPSIIILLMMLIAFGCNLAFGTEDKPYEFSPFVDANGSIHGGIGKHYDGLAGSIGFGAELLYVVNNRFAVGPVAKTNVHYELYNSDINSDEMVMDEYGLWTASIGGIVYMGNSFYTSVQAMMLLDDFYHSTYIHNGSQDNEIDPFKYNIDDLDMVLEIGLRVDYHASIYAEITTHLVETAVNTSKYQLYIGLRFHI